MHFQTLEPTAKLSGQANQVNLGHAVDQQCCVQQDRSERVH